ncbi:ABC transporter substrate-binding protein [Macrococcus brunensis]|uniref:ABC transporter substrate-binding protein n=1 Tax=Macrococcus brunensis TaxID=198483 RepID=UPI001EF0E42D|nr:ABC transporter substrate-binding protein [Macrococcus brunensis]ULG72368.1 ABC transporter substrate-binding protein [Macrococcus brunensis]
MKKFLVFLCALLLVLAACGNDTKETKESKESKTAMKDYKTESGKTIKVPEHPKRVAVMTAFYVGDFLELGIKPVAVPAWTKDSSIIGPHLKDVKLVGDNNIEQVVEAKPDLIIADATDKNIKKYEKIAPTVPFTYTNYDYKSILTELGNLVGEKEKAADWIEEWNAKTKNDQQEIKKKVGTATASVFELDTKQIYIYEKNWGRGLDIVHDVFGMPMTKTYQQALDKEKKGYDAISVEEIGKYAGDFIFLSKPSYSKMDIEKSNLWSNLDAVKNKRVISYKAEDFWFTDPLTLEALRTELKAEILKTH